MYGRPLIDEQAPEFLSTELAGPRGPRRRQVLRETLAALDTEAKRRALHQQAESNLARWRSERVSPAHDPFEVRVLPGDWGEVAGALTRELGTCLAVLNMANAYVPGGAYVEGAAAQEENMFRRTDCHFSITDVDYDASTDRYRPHETTLLSASDGRVYLDTESPRVCLRGAEDLELDDLGYAWLPEEQVFPFFELRAAALDLRGEEVFDLDEARGRISAQLDTLRDARIRHAVLGAFGCGAFENPADLVARIYREEIEERREDFSLIAFAVFAPGYGPDNYTPFAAEFS